jgi:hypothetical protein
VAGALDSAAAALGGRPGFFFVKSSSAAALRAALDVDTGVAFFSVLVGALLADLVALVAGLADF